MGVTTLVKYKRLYISKLLTISFNKILRFNPLYKYISIIPLRYIITLLLLQVIVYIIKNNSYIIFLFII